MLREEVELCSYCMGENVLQWDVEKDGYKAKCQHCGEEMMLCDACFIPMIMKIIIVIGQKRDAGEAVFMQMIQKRQKNL